VRRSRHRRVASGIALAIAMSFVVLPSAQSADQSPELSQIDKAIRDINSCLVSKPDPVLDVYYLMDGSGSLADDNGRPGADPDGIRFDAVEESIAPLAELAASDVEVNVAAGTFGDDASQVLPWTRVNPQDADSLAAQINSDLRAAFNKENTNWVAGLSLAEQQLELARRDGPRCQTLIWITDGGIYLNSDPQVNADGIVEICGVDPTEFGEAKALGSMFRLRNSGVVVLGILLSDPKAPNESRTTYFPPIVEGVGPVDAEYFGGDSGQFSCGQVQAGATGAAIPARSPSDLADELWAISVCITEECVPGLGEGLVLDQNDEGDWFLPVPGGISTVVLRPRSDSVGIFDPYGQDVCAMGVDCEVRNGTVRLPVLGNPGVWTVSTGQSTSPNARFLTEIVMDRYESDDLIAGEPAEVVVLPEQAGAPFLVDLFDEVAFNWEFSSDTGKESQGLVDSDGLLLDFVPDAGGRLTVTLEAVTYPEEIDGIQIPGFSDRRVGFTDLRVRPVGDYPELLGATEGDRDLVVFPTIEGVGSSTAFIEVRGPQEGGGIVCLEAPTVESDPAATEVGRSLTFSTEFDCSTGGGSVSAGEVLRIPIKASVDEQFSGIARGKFNLQLEPSDGGRAFPSSVDFELPSTLQRNDGAAFVAIVALTILGLVLPYLALLVLARRQASFSADLDGSRYATLPIRVTQEGLASIGEMSVSEYAFVYMNRGGVQREVATAAVTHRIVPPRLWPFAPIKCDAHGPATSLLVSNLSGDLSPMSPTAPSSQALPDVFVAYFERPETPQASAGGSGVSDWDAEQNPAAVSIDDRVLDGQLVVILPESGNPAEAAERALAKVRVWPRWPEVFNSVKNSSRPLAVNKTAGTDPPPSQAPRHDPLSDW